MGEPGSAGGQPSPVVAPVAIRTWPRLALAAALQLPPIAVAVWGQPPWAAWVAGLIGASICIAATDSRWRWRNRLLVLTAGLWLLWAISPV